MNLTNNSQPSSDELQPQLEAAVWSVLSEPIDPAAVQRVKDRAAALADNPAPETVVRRDTSRHDVMHRRYSLSLVGLAAAVLLVFGLSMMMPTTPAAFAQAIERLKAAGAFSFKESVYVKDQDAPVEAKVFVAADGRTRRELNGVINVSDSNGIPRLTLLEQSKKAITSSTPAIAPAKSFNQLRWLDELKARGSKPDKSLGEQTLAGHKCTVFEVNVAQSVYRVWVENGTNDLLQIEFEGMPEGSPVLKMVMSDFKFEQSFDDSLFSLDVPDGYQLMPSIEPPKALPPEESLVEALKGYTELSNGKLPDSIADWGKWAVALSESKASLDKTTAIASRLGSVLPFLVSMPKADYEYSGAGKTTRDDKSIIFWYRNSDKKLRAIYNDLTTGDIAEADLKTK